MKRTPPYELTAEQQEALRLYRTGRSLKLQAGAGATKTTTLVEMAYDQPQVPVQYVAFNASIVEEAATKFPSNVNCRTMHKLAMAAVGYPLAHRLPTVRMASRDLVQHLQLDPLFVTVGDTGERKRLAPGYLAGLTMRTVEEYCKTADRELSDRHVPYVKCVDAPGRYDNQRLVRQHIRAAVRRAWADVTSPQGVLPFKHGHYLKLWQLGTPYINAKAIFVDEAQDLPPVMVDIVAQQDHAQVVWVGDSQQQIYSFTGAVNALETMDADHTGYLTHSFRFGPQVAAVANHLLGKVAATLRLVGAGPASTVGAVDDPDCVLTRTNAEAVQRMLGALAAGRQPYLMGGGKEVRAFVEGARNLQRDGWCSHPELACFSSWGEVQAYVEQDEQGEDLRLLVKLVDQFGAEAILAALDQCPKREADADLVISTAHKAKGREWPRVQLAGDFPTEEPKTDEEVRLLYVAVTRAQVALDITRVGYLVQQGLAGDGAVPVAEPVAAAQVQPTMYTLALPRVEAPDAQPEPVPALGDALALLEQGLALLPTNQPGTATWRQQVLRLLAVHEGDVAAAPGAPAAAAATASSNGTHPDADISMALPAPRQAPPDMVEAQRQLVDQALGAGDTNLALALQQLREANPPVPVAARATFVDDGEPF